VSPDMESLKDREQFFNVGIVVEFGGREGMGMEGHGVDFTGVS
jgi:hypothetical protein